MEFKSHIPNAITMLNLLCGTISIILLFHGFYIEAALLVGLAAVFDFLDGLVAKLLNSKSLIGKELDSLADVVSFGLAPAMFLFILMSKNENVSSNNGVFQFLPYLSLAIAVFSALRLAKFNLDTRQTVSFVGLPTPANAIFIISFSIIGLTANSLLPVINQITANLCVEIIVIGIFSFLLVSEIPMFSMKFNKGYGFKINAVKYSFLIITIVLILALGWSGIALSMLIYIIMSLIFTGK